VSGVRIGGSDVSRIECGGVPVRVVCAGETIWAPYSISVPTNSIFGGAAPGFFESLTSYTVTIPATDKKDGDLIMVFVSTDGNKAISASSGWTLVGSLTGDPTCYVFARFWSGTASMSVTFSWSGSEDVAYATLHLRDTTRDLSEIKWGTVKTGDGSPVSTNALTMDRQDEYLWVAAVGMSSGYITGVVEGWGGASGASGTSAANAGVGYVFLLQKGTSLTATGIELSGSASWRSAMMAIPPRKS